MLLQRIKLKTFAEFNSTLLFIIYKESNMAEYKKKAVAWNNWEFLYEDE